MMENKHPDEDQIESKLPQWHQEIIDARLEVIENNPERIRPISELLVELDK